MAMNPQAMMKQAKKMQKKMEEIQAQAALETVEATAGGGMVAVKVSGALQLQEVTIDPEAVDPEDVEMLQDMIMAAVNEAIRSVGELANKQMGAITGGLNIPGMPF